jgi:catechol 2,3-dioxygenase-like lactoylglutathione lyase family enzyme
MKMKAISGIVCYAKNLQKTAKFYEDLGFRFGKNEADYLICYLNWFWMEFHQGETSQNESDQAVYISVEDVDEFYAGVLSKGLKPSSESTDTPQGRREFSLSDPDGHRLVFFAKK